MHEIGRGKFKSLFCFVMWCIPFFLEVFQFTWRILWNSCSHVTKASFETPSATYLITYPTTRGHVVSNIDDLKQNIGGKIALLQSARTYSLLPKNCSSVGSGALAPGLKPPNLDRKVYPLKPELNSICYLLALLGAHHFLHVSRIRVKLLTFRRLMSYIYGAPILDVSRSHTTTQHSR